MAKLIAWLFVAGKLLTTGGTMLILIAILAYPQIKLALSGDLEGQPYWDILVRMSKRNRRAPWL
jgi:hypothetical protein